MGEAFKVTHHSRLNFCGKANIGAPAISWPHSLHCCSGKNCYIQACSNRCKELTDHAIMSSSLLIDSKICGFRVYFKIWEPYVREEFLCKIEEDNDPDPYAVSMMKQRQIVGHVICSISRAFAVHLRSHGAVTCTVTSGREYSSDLEQGGLQIPSTLCFTGDKIG